MQRHRQHDAKARWSGYHARQGQHEDALRARPEGIREPYRRRLRNLQQAYGEAMLELKARRIQSLLDKDEP